MGVFRFWSPGRQIGIDEARLVRWWALGLAACDPIDVLFWIMKRLRTWLARGIKETYLGIAFRGACGGSSPAIAQIPLNESPIKCEPLRHYLFACINVDAVPQTRNQRAYSASVTWGVSRLI